MPNNIFIEVKAKFSLAIFIPAGASEAALTWWLMTVVTNIQNMWRNHLLFNGCGIEELFVALNSLRQDKLEQMSLTLSAFLRWRGQCFLQNIFVGELNPVEFPGKRETVYGFTNRNQYFMFYSALLSTGCRAYITLCCRGIIQVTFQFRPRCCALQ